MFWVIRREWKTWTFFSNRSIWVFGLIDSNYLVYQNTVVAHRQYQRKHKICTFSAPVFWKSEIFSILPFYNIIRERAERLFHERLFFLGTISKVLITLHDYQAQGSYVVDTWSITTYMLHYMGYQSQAQERPCLVIGRIWQTSSLEKLCSHFELASLYGLVKLVWDAISSCTYQASAQIH